MKELLKMIVSWLCRKREKGKDSVTVNAFKSTIVIVVRKKD